MNEISNRHIRNSETLEFYVILVKRGSITKGVARGRWLKHHINCTVLPQKMMRFRTEDKAIEFWAANQWRDKELELYKIVKLTINYKLDS